MKKFEIKKNTEQIDIHGEIFEIDVTNSKIKEQILKGHHLQKEAERILQMSEDATIEEQAKAIDEVESLLEETTDFVLGEGAFQKLYPKTGESIYVMSDVLYQVIEYTKEKQQEDLEKKKAKYTKKRR